MNLLANYYIPNLPLTEFSAATLDHVYRHKALPTDAATWYSAFIKKTLAFSFGDSLSRKFQIMFLVYENTARDLSKVCEPKACIQFILNDSVVFTRLIHSHSFPWQNQPFGYREDH